MTKILVADDEHNILALLEIILKDLGATVVCAEDGQVAIDKLQVEKPDLIITDVVMPNKNGFEVCRHVRSMPDIADTPIIILSALGDEYNKITGFEEGADDYVIKPFNVEELKARAKTLLLRHASRQAHFSTVPQASVTMDDPKLIPSSYAVLDMKMGGGMPKGSNILTLGSLGLGKSFFCRSFICEGLKREEPCLFIALDDDPKKIRQSLEQQLPEPLSFYEDAGLFRLVDAFSWSSMTQDNEEQYAVNGHLELTQLSGVISDASYDLGQTVQEKRGGRRVIDSISSLMIHFDLAAVQRFLNQIARTSIALGDVTTLFLMEDGTVTEQDLNHIKYVMDGIIEFNLYQNQRAVRVTSMKWSSYDGDWVVF
ncbi:MAG: response regulator [bacterium]